MLNPDRYFDPDPSARDIARTLYRQVERLPLICPHGHVDPKLLAMDEPFPDPAQLLIIPDHYIYRMLYSQGISLESLGIPRRDGVEVETDSRKIWQLFCDHFYLFRGTPTSCWLRDELETVFGVSKPINSQTAQEIYDDISAKLSLPEFRPRALFESFNIEVLSTTDPATSDLSYHRLIRESEWTGDVRPTFRPDGVINILQSSWQENIDRLAELEGRELGSFSAFIQALEGRREFFKSMGATATDHATLIPLVAECPKNEAQSIYQRALSGTADQSDAERFSAHMLMEMARMSVEDGLVMQLHPGSLRDHNQIIFERFGPDSGADIPIPVEFTRNLQEVLNRFGNHPNFRLILFTLDETTYSRELAPLAGHYPAVRLGPPWWFFDSLEGMRRFREAVTETAGIYNTVGFNDDTRAFPSIPARHDLARRADANFLASLVARHIITLEEAQEMAVDLAYRLARRSYRLG